MVLNELKPPVPKPPAPKPKPDGINWSDKLAGGSNAQALQKLWNYSTAVWRAFDMLNRMGERMAMPEPADEW
jgi:hypothetical protein